MRDNANQRPNMDTQNARDSIDDIQVAVLKMKQAICELENSGKPSQTAFVGAAQKISIFPNRNQFVTREDPNEFSIIRNANSNLVWGDK